MPGKRFCHKGCHFLTPHHVALLAFIKPVALEIAAIVLDHGAGRHNQLGGRLKVIISPCALAVRPEHNQEEEPYRELWHDVYDRVAKEHHLWIAGSSNVGEIRHGAWEGHPCVGCSILVDPDGEVRACGAYREEEIVCAEINL